MPELPEVETTLRGIKPFIINQSVSKAIIRHKQLRWPIPASLKTKISGKIVKSLTRRAKYLLVGFETGTLIIHLGMSGRLSVLTAPKHPEKHDHIDIEFANQVCLRYTDPRRFGAVLWIENDPNNHPLLTNIGPEPLSKLFNVRYLITKASSKNTAIKEFIMDSKIVGGVGNIYATEALFASGIHPKKPAAKVSEDEFKKLVPAIKSILKTAIKRGGTTLKDFANPNGNPGYFSIQLKVYGRAGEKCVRCKQLLTSIKIAQRSTVFCTNCQK